MSMYDTLTAAMTAGQFRHFASIVSAIRCELDATGRQDWTVAWAPDSIVGQFGIPPK